MAYISSCSTTDAGGDDGMGQLFGPGHVDQTIRQAIQLCWMALPKNKRNVEEVDRQIRRLVERALQNLLEDTEAFGRIEAEPGTASGSCGK